MADNFSSVVDSAMTPPASTSPRDMIMTLPAEVEKKQQTALDQLKQKEQASMAAQDVRYTAAMKKYNDAMSGVKAPEDPNLKDMPTAPNQKMQDPTQVLGSLGTILAIFGSMKTRAPMTSALNSMAAAMKGFLQGDQEAIKLNTEKWQNDFKTALAQNQIEMQKYMNALEKNKFDMAGAQADLRVLAVEMQDKQMHDAVDQGDYTKQSAILSGRLNAGMKGAETLAKMNATETAHADAMRAHQDSADATATYRQHIAATQELARSDINTRWFMANAQKQVKPFQDTIRKANDVESNLVAGMVMPDTLKMELKQMVGTGRVGRWTMGLDKYTGDLVTRIFSGVEKGTLGTLSQQDTDAMRAFIANVKAINAQEIQKIKSSMKPYADQYHIPEPIFDIPFSASGAAGDLGEAYPGMDQSSSDALGIAKDMAGGK